jgi:hypothetical protein
MKHKLELFVSNLVVGMRKSFVKRRAWEAMRIVKHLPDMERR